MATSVTRASAWFFVQIPFQAGSTGSTQPIAGHRCVIARHARALQNAAVRSDRGLNIQSSLPPDARISVASSGRQARKIYQTIRQMHQFSQEPG
jgi:hypothetical protein